MDTTPIILCLLGAATLYGLGLHVRRLVRERRRINRLVDLYYQTQHPGPADPAPGSGP